MKLFCCESQATIQSYNTADLTKIRKQLRKLPTKGSPLAKSVSYASLGYAERSGNNTYTVSQQEFDHLNAKDELLTMSSILFDGVAADLIQELVTDSAQF